MVKRTQLIDELNLIKSDMKENELINKSENTNIIIEYRKKIVEDELKFREKEEKDIQKTFTGIFSYDIRVLLIKFYYYT